MHTITHARTDTGAAVATPLPLDPAVAAAGIVAPITAEADLLLEEWSHVDPDDNPIRYSMLWQEIQRQSSFSGAA